MATFIKSEDIAVFPAVHRDTIYSKAKRTTEENLTKFAKLSSNKANLSQLFVDPDDSNYIIFNIAGYWFRCSATTITDLDIDTTNLYAYITLINDTNLGYTLCPDGAVYSGGPLDVALVVEGPLYFKGLTFTNETIPESVAPDVLYYSLQVTDSNGALLLQNLKLDATEVRNDKTDITNKSIKEQFNTGKLIATTINGLTIDSTTGTLDVAAGKKLTVNGSVTLAGTGTATLNKNLTVNNNNITLEASGAERTLKISDANKTIAGAGTKITIGATPTINGSGTLALNKNLIIANTHNMTLEAAGADRTLKISGASKEIAGAGTSLTINNSLNIAGTSEQITLGTHPYTLAFTTTDDTDLTLPIEGTLATIDGDEDFTNKTYNGLTLTATDSGFLIGNEAASKSLIVNATYTLRDACAKGVKDVTTPTPTAVVSSGTNLMTERAVYYGLPLINASHSYNSSTSIYAPTSAGTAGRLLVAQGSSTAPTWANPSTLTVGNATKTAFTNTGWSPPLPINVQFVDNLVGKTLEIGVMYNDQSSPPIYHNLGIITLLPDMPSTEWHVGSFMVSNSHYSLTIGPNMNIYLRNGTTLITSSNFALRYRIIT